MDPGRWHPLFLEKCVFEAVQSQYDVPHRMEHSRQGYTGRETHVPLWRQGVSGLGGILRLC